MWGVGINVKYEEWIEYEMRMKTYPCFHGVTNTELFTIRFKKYLLDQYEEEMQAKRIDSNQPEIVAKLRAVPGVVVFHTHEVGKGFGDIVCGFRGNNYIFEIKDPDKPKSKRKLTPKEKIFHETWPGQVDTIETAEEALLIMGAI